MAFELDEMVNELATEKLRFTTVKLFSVGAPLKKVLRRQTNWEFEGQPIRMKSYSISNRINCILQQNMPKFQIIFVLLQFLTRWLPTTR